VSFEEVSLVSFCTASSIFTSSFIFKFDFLKKEKEEEIRKKKKREEKKKKTLRYWTTGLSFL